MLDRYEWRDRDGMLHIVTTDRVYQRPVFDGEEIEVDMGLPSARDHEILRLAEVIRSMTWDATPGSWTPLSPATLPPPERPLLVTKNIGSRLANGQMATLFLVWSVHYTPPRDGSREEFYAYTREGELVRWLTHWRLAVPEEG